MLSFLRHGRPATGGDAAVGVLLRVSGIASLLLFSFGLVMSAMGAWTLIRMQTQGDQTGWDGLIGGVALMLGAMMVLGGVLVALGSHEAFKGWREQRPRPVRIAGWAFIVVGLLASVPGAVFGTMPLDLYVLVAGALVAALGAAMVAWAAEKAQRGPA